MVLALDNIEVLDLSRLLPGPYCSMILADFGARVLKVEDTGRGDYFRTMSALAGGYQTVNRNKKSLALNLKDPRGREIFYRLAARADVVLEGFRPGVTARLGVDYSTLQKLNPRLVYCSLTGYGQEGPRSQSPGHDLNYIGLAGILGLTGAAGGPPVIPSVQLADLGGGALWAAIAILVALLARERTGQGQYLDVAMLDGTLAFLPLMAEGILAGGTPPVRGSLPLSGALACYRVYATSDRKYVTLGALEEKFWTEFCLALNRPGWVDRQFGPEQEQLAGEVAEILSSRTRDQWLEFFAGRDVCLEPVYDPGEIAADEHIKARGMLGPGPYLGIPVKLSTTPGGVREPAPGWGEHSREVLAELGYTGQEIDGFLAGEVIKESGQS
ncbi:MAG TPA: CaiB/BaiF CoA-transferase family protein [Spirochaetia bacterium]|nr:CaiB/BaiF CoA-transferase family protein [Spirochaetia bacterium]